MQLNAVTRTVYPVPKLLLGNERTHRGEAVWRRWMQWTPPLITVKVNEEAHTHAQGGP
jgi:hypothetical protein